MIVRNLTRHAAVAALCLLFILANAAAGRAEPGVNGRNVTIVGTPDAQFKLLPLRQWLEQGKNGSSFNFIEHNRDDWSVYLFDASRNVRLQLDMHRRQVLYGDETAPQMRFLYPIVGSSAGVNGRNVIRAEASSGQFRMTAANAWIEQGYNGVSFNFVEEARDDWSVYLLDNSRGVRLQIDLHRRQIFYADAGAPQMRPLYPITAVSAID